MPKPVGLWGAYVMGLAFAFGWTPCIGPILAAILAVAASKDTVAKGATLLAVYSAGLGIPFLMAAAAVEPVMAAIARFRCHLAIVEKVMGGLLVLTGIAFLTGWVSEAGFWLLEWFPAWGRSGRAGFSVTSAKADDPVAPALREPQRRCAIESAELLDVPLSRDVTIQVTRSPRR